MTIGTIECELDHGRRRDQMAKKIRRVLQFGVVSGSATIQKVKTSAGSEGY